MISDAHDSLVLQPWLVVFPGAAIAVVVLCVNLCGDARDLSSNPAADVNGASIREGADAH